MNGHKISRLSFQHLAISNNLPMGKIANSEVPPIIMLQSDHGPRNTYIDGRYPTNTILS